MTLNKKYELITSDSTEVDGKTLYRIRALRDFGCHVDAGDFGGYIESEKNLSHDGLCWIDGNAKVYGDALVCEDADIGGYTLVSGKLRVGGNTLICGNIDLGGYTRICGNALIVGRPEEVKS